MMISFVSSILFVSVDNLFVNRENGFVNFTGDRQPLAKMENLLPSDIWRAHVLPSLDLMSRIELNRTLDAETRLAKNVKPMFAKLTKTMALDMAVGIMERHGFAVAIVDQVKTALDLFVFLQTAFGRILLELPGFVEVVRLKLDHLEASHPKPWWNKSPYRKKLRVAMEGVRTIILTVV